MSLHIPRKLLDLTAETLGITHKKQADQENQAKKEISNQASRILQAYSGKRIHRAVYWSPIDTYALYTLTACQYLSNSAIDMAAKDLELVEANLAKMPPDEQQVFNSLVLFLDSLSQPPRKQTVSKFNRVLQDWVDRFSLGQLQFLQKLLATQHEAKSGDKKEQKDDDPIDDFLTRAVHDAIRRVRQNTVQAIKSRFNERLMFIRGRLDELAVMKSRKGDTKPEELDVKVTVDEIVKADANAETDVKK